MLGGAGNDIYDVDVAGDVVTELAGVGTGTDRVQASISYILGANVEELVLSGSANLNGTGNTFKNRLEGNSGNNVLNGMTDADTMLGGDGNDTYFVDNPLDVVTESPGNGTADLVISTRNFDLSTEGANVEQLTLTGIAVA